MNEKIVPKSISKQVSPDGTENEGKLDLLGCFSYCAAGAHGTESALEHVEGGVCRSLSRRGLVETGSAPESGARVWAGAWRGCWCGKFGRPRIQEDIAVPDFREKVA